MALTSAEYFAVSNHLTDWPHTMTYDEVCDGIIYGHEDVIVWEKFENYLPVDVVDIIEDMRVSFIRTVSAMTRGLRDAIREGDPMDIADHLRGLENQLGV